MKTILVIVCFLICLSSYTQKGQVTFGFQYKPILPVEFLNVENLSLTNDDLSVDFTQTLGLNFGGVIRWNILKRLSLESGINYVRRNFKYEASVASSGATGTDDFSIVGYETPIKGLVIVQLSRSSFISAATGITTSWTASSVASGTEDKNFRQYTNAKKLNLALIANVGYEFKTDKSGTFYFGASLNSPFQAIGVTEVIYDDLANEEQKIRGALLGNYLTLDLRYYFHEDKSKSKR